jgi:hypothetical protein
MKALFLSSLVIIAVVTSTCTKDKTYPWRDGEVYSHELTGDSCKQWHLVFQTKYVWKNYKPDTSIQSRNFSPGYSITFYADGTLKIGDSLQPLIGLGAVTSWSKIGSGEPFAFLNVGGQFWEFSRYYPKPPYDKEGIILFAKYSFRNGDAVGYEMSFDNN